MPSKVMCIKVPEELWRRAEELRGVVRWSEEVRRFLEDRINTLEKSVLLEEIASTVPQTGARRGLAEGVVYERRRSRHHGPTQVPT